MRFCQACGLDHDRHAGQIASSVTGCSCVLSEAHLQDRAPRCAVVLALPSPQAPYRASGLVLWRKRTCDPEEAVPLMTPNRTCATASFRSAILVPTSHRCEGCAIVSVG